MVVQLLFLEITIVSRVGDAVLTTNIFDHTTDLNLFKYFDDLRFFESSFPH